jgi:N-acetylmuramoyl-L-alanine amidase
MTSPQLPIEWHPSPNFERGRGGETPCAIVVHTTAGGWDGALDWFSRPESGVSAHYLVGLDGRVVQLVDEGDTARHCGRVRDPVAPIVSDSQANPNRFTIGIEFEDEGQPLDVLRPDAQYEAGAALIADACARWDIPVDRGHVIGHREIFAAKDCPGNLDVERLVAGARPISA